MDCSCIYVDYGDVEEPDLYSSEMRRARKSHTCEECRREITPRENYEYVRVLYDDFWNDYKTCEDCLSIRKAFYCQGWMHGGMWEDVEYHIAECWDDVGSATIMKLTPRAREKICELIEERWEGMDE